MGTQRKIYPRPFSRLLPPQGTGPDTNPALAVVVLLGLGR